MYTLLFSIKYSALEQVAVEIVTDFVGTLQFLRIALWVAMETMHYHIGYISYF